MPRSGHIFPTCWESIFGTAAEFIDTIRAREIKTAKTTVFPSLLGNVAALCGNIQQ